MDGHAGVLSPGFNLLPCGGIKTDSGTWGGMGEFGGFHISHKGKLEGESFYDYAYYWLNYETTGITYSTVSENINPAGTVRCIKDPE